MAAPQQLASFFSQSTKFEHSRADVYPPLDTNCRDIRLMTIHPGDRNDHICITLEKASLDENPLYEAISYTWEDLIEKRTVSFNSHEYVITKNQFEAVRHFRRKDATRVLWMDIFCIDQANLTEKGHQVSMMGDIYSVATTTLVWLGQFNEDWVGEVSSEQLHEAAELLKSLPDMPRLPEDSSRLALSPHLAEFNDAANRENGHLMAAVYVLLLLAADHHLLQMPVYSVDDKGQPLPNPAWYKAVETLRIILERPWWERAWVLQEVAWSKQSPVAYMGSFELPLATFWNAAAALVKHVMYPGACCTKNFKVWGLRDIADTRALITRVAFLYGFQGIRELIADGQVSFEQAVSFSSNRKVTDPRDCIYSLLSLVSKDQRVHVDYNYSVAETYTSASWKGFQLENSLNRLRHGGSKNGPNTWQLPSWVQDWSKDPTYSPFFDWIHNIRTYTVAPDWRRTVLDASDGSLTVPYVILDIVEACFPAIAASHDWRFHILTTIWLQQLLESDCSFDLTTFIRTVFRNTGVNTHSTFKPGDLENLITFYQQYSEVGHSTDPEPPGFTIFDLQMAFSSSIRESCLFVTRQKRLGIGHEGIKPGDVLCHVKGCCVPLAVRSADCSDLLESGSAAEDVENFTLIDACYLDSGMDLENTDVDWDTAKDIKLV